MINFYDKVDDQRMISSEYTQKGSTIQGMTNSHIHDSYEIYFLLEGERYYFIHDKTYNVKKGMLVLIHPNVIHKTIKAERSDHERLLINIHPAIMKQYAQGFDSQDWFSGFDGDRPVLALNISNQSQLREKMLAVYCELNEKEEISFNRVMIGVMDILLFLSELRSSDWSDRSEMVLENQTSLRVNDVVRYINDHFDSNLTLASLAKNFFFSPSYLSRCFKQITGFNLKDYINQVRLLEAEKKLTNTSLSISDIGRLTGFSSQTHFGRQFKKYKGITPTLYRKKSILNNL